MTDESETGRSMIRRILLENQTNTEKIGVTVLEDLWTILDSAIVVPSVCAEKVSNSDDEKDHVLWLMLCNALSDIISAYNLILQGFQRPPPVILRGVVENLAAVVTFHSSDKIYKKFKDGKFHIPKAIGPSKTYFSNLYKYYGQLSNVFVHETFESVGRQIGKEKGIRIVPQVSSELSTEQVSMFCYLGMVAFELGQITEWCFIRFYDSPTYWKIEKDNKLTATGGVYRAAVGKLASHLEEVLKKLGPRN